MSHFYYQVLRRIQSQLSTLQVFYLQAIQLLFYTWTIQFLYNFYNTTQNFPSYTGRYIFDQLLVFFIARSI